jgi:glycerol-3-phosphate acyltransferase PlsX
MMRIAVDAMGGDHAPNQIVLGALQAAAAMRSEIILVGDPARIQEHMPPKPPKNITIHPASQVIEMEEKPLEALRKKKDSSLAVAIDLVKKGEAEAVFSAGNTGACTAGCLLSWRQIEGVERPAIASQMPSMHGGFLMLDAGASPDVDPKNLIEFAMMGRAYANRVMGRKNPKVHLMNIGEEPGKGNAFSKAAYELLKEYPWFAGNIEGKDVFLEPVDVVVMDAFVGNIVLKTCEGAAEFFMRIVKDRVPTNPLARLPYLPLKTLLTPLKKMSDYAEVGGSPLLGLNGICIIGHGRSNAKAAKNAVLLANRAVESRLLDSMRKELSMVVSSAK